MSKNTSNSVAELLPMPMERVLAMYNTLVDITKKEQEASEKQQKEAMGGNSSMNPNRMMAGMNNQVSSMTSRINSGIPSMPSMPSIPHF